MRFYQNIFFPGKRQEGRAAAISKFVSRGLSSRRNGSLIELWGGGRAESVFWWHRLKNGSLFFGLLLVGLGVTRGVGWLGGVGLERPTVSE